MLVISHVLTLSSIIGAGVLGILLLPWTTKEQEDTITGCQIIVRHVLCSVLRVR